MGLFDSFFGDGGGTTQSSKVWGPQRDPFEQLYAQAAALAAQQQPLVGQYGQQLSSDLLGQGQQFNSSLQGIAGGTNPFIQGLQGFGSGAQTQAATDALGFNINRQLQQQILPSLQSDAIFAGSLGQDRSQIAQGMAAQGAMGAFSSGAAQIGLQGMQSELSALTAGAGIQGQAAMGGVAGLEGMFNLGMGGYGSEWLPLMNQSSIMGSPTVLGQGSSGGPSNGILDFVSFGFG